MWIFEAIKPYLLWAGIIIPLLAIMFFLFILFRASRISVKKGRRKSPLPVMEDLSSRAAESLSEMIRFKTVSSPESNAPAYFSALLRMRDYIKSRYPNVHERMERETVAEYSLVYRWAGRNEGLNPILFCAHMDVVPAEGEWKHEPFSGDVSGNHVHGRGTLDCKNILVCLMEAAEALIGEGFIPERDIYFAFGHDEETGGENGAKNIARLFAGRGITFDMVLDEGGAVQRGYMGVKKPVASVAVTEKGFLTLKLTAHSAGGHSSTPPRHSAIGVISEAVCRVEYKQRKAKLLPVVEEQLLRLVSYMPSRMRLMTANLWCFKRRILKKMANESHNNALIRTTVASTMTRAGSAPNVLPQKAEVILNLRPIHGDSCVKLTEFVSDLVKGLGVEVEVMRGDDASKISSYSSKEFKMLESAISDSFGDVVVIPAVMIGGTDARKYEELCENVYRFCPFVMTAADSAKIHAANESVRIDYLGVAAEFYKNIFKAF